LQQKPLTTNSLRQNLLYFKASYSTQYSAKNELITAKVVTYTRIAVKYDKEKRVLSEKDFVAARELSKAVMG